MGEKIENVAANPYPTKKEEERRKKSTQKRRRKAPSREIINLLGAKQAGIYDAAARTSRWITFILQTILLVAAPEFSRLYQQNDRQGLQQMVTTITVWIFWPSLLIMDRSRKPSASCLWSDSLA